MIYELQPKYDSRKSFYGKAFVEEKENCKILTSYQTDVAMIKDGKFYLKGMYSATTSRHIRDFAYQNGFNTDRKSLLGYIQDTQNDKVRF